MFVDWNSVIIERYWPHLGDAQIKEIALRCISALYIGIREVPMMLEHAQVPIRYKLMKSYAHWLVIPEVHVSMTVGEI